MDDNNINNVENTEIPEVSAPEAAPEVIPEAAPEAAPAENTAPVENEAAPAQEQPAQPEIQQVYQQPQTAISAVPQQAQPSKFAMTAKQLWVIIKNFFSKNCVDAISAQYDEALPVWGILLPAYVLLSAISATVSFNASGTFNSFLSTGLSSKITFGSGEVFFVTLALHLMLAFAMPLGVRAFIKFHKGDGHFLSSANLVTASYLPVMLFYAFNILTGGSLTAIVSYLSVLGEIASYMLLFSGISRKLGGKKPIWSFFLMIIITTAVAIIVAMVIILPILFSRIAFSIMDNIR